MSRVEGSTIECDSCNTEIQRSQAIMDKGNNYPELLKIARQDDRDFIRLCTNCAGITN